MTYFKPKRIKVLVRKDAFTQITQSLYEHEVPMLQVAIGRGNVEEVKNRTVIQDPEPVSVETEYERLVDVYGPHPEIPMPLVEYIYGTLESGKLLAAGGGPVEWEPPEEQEIHIPEAAPAAARRKRA